MQDLAKLLALLICLVVTRLNWVSGLSKVGSRDLILNFGTPIHIS